MTPTEAVLMDWLLERGYTREQAARALVALTLPEPTQSVYEWTRAVNPPRSLEAAWMQHESERRGYLPKP